MWLIKSRNHKCEKPYDVCLYGTGLLGLTWWYQQYFPASDGTSSSWLKTLHVSMPQCSPCPRCWHLMWFPSLWSQRVQQWTPVSALWQSFTNPTAAASPSSIFNNIDWDFLCKYQGVVDQLFSFMSFLKLCRVRVLPASTGVLSESTPVLENILLEENSYLQRSLQ